MFEDIILKKTVIERPKIRDDDACSQCNGQKAVDYSRSKVATLYCPTCTKTWYRAYKDDEKLYRSNINV